MSTSSTGDLPRRAELRSVAEWLERAERGQWSLADWLAWTRGGHVWQRRATRALILLIPRLEALEAENRRLLGEIEALRRRSVSVPPRRPARPPPPPLPEARAVSGLAGRPPTDLEAEVLRRVDARLREVVAEEWREVSQVQFEDEVWADAGETIFDESVPE